LLSINFKRIYPLSEAYESIKKLAIQVLDKYLQYPDLIKFDDSDRSVTFTTEKLIPIASSKRPCVMLLFSNPHPYSVHQGMFLSPNIKGRESLFWSAMRDADWLSIEEEKCNPKQLADICLKASYRGPFKLIFYCYYAFPTSLPEDISKIFGKKYFSQFIKPEAIDEFRKTIRETSVEAVVTFNKGIFNLVSKDPITRYINQLNEGELIQSQIKSIDRYTPVFLTYPTGWRYHRAYKQFRIASLDIIKTAIISGSNISESKNS